jgi:hypothetical protein
MSTDWLAKLNAPAEPVVKPAPVSIAGMRAGQIMLVPTPLLVDAAIRRLKRGQSLSPQALRARLADEWQAEVCCPIYTGFHLRTVAEAAFVQLQSGLPLPNIAPFWRVIGTSSPTFKKLSFDAQFVRDQRALEGLPP